LTWWLNEDNYIFEDTIKTASHIICKVCLQTLYDTQKSMLEGRGVKVLTKRSTKAVETLEMCRVLLKTGIVRCWFEDIQFKFIIVFFKILFYKLNNDFLSI
jgi:hypothetical protein